MPMWRNGRRACLKNKSRNWGVGSTPTIGTRIFIMKLTDSKLNSRAVIALDNPFIFLRIENCILVAKTELAKRRLIRATIVLSGIKAVDQNTNDMAGWTQPL
jgi:hypothetical protein